MSEALKQTIRQIVEDHLMLTSNYKDGTYFHMLTRCKSSYGVGTMNVDDFVEIGDEISEPLINELTEAIVKMIELKDVL